MKKISLIFMTAVLVGLMSLPAYGQGHSGTRSNRGAQLHGKSRADEVHTLNAAKKKDKKGKKSHKFGFHHNDKDKGKGKGDNK